MSQQCQQLLGRLGEFPQPNVGIVKRDRSVFRHKTRYVGQKKGVKRNLQLEAIKSIRRERLFWWVPLLR